MHISFQNLNEDRFHRKGSALRHGRLWWYFDKTHEGHGYTAEWVLFKPFCGAKIEMSAEDDDQLKAHFAIPFIFSVWIGRRFPWKHWIKKSLPQTDSREIGVTIHDWTIWFSLWNNPNHWRSSDPKWWSFNINVPDFLFGKQKYSNVDLEHQDVLIPMPEKAYRGKAKIFESTWKRPRLPWAKRMIRCEIEVPDGLPIPGKGTADYNCGQDATFSMTLPAKTISEGIAGLVESSLERRNRYGGRNWVPEANNRKGR